MSRIQESLQQDYNNCQLLSKCQKGDYDFVQDLIKRGVNVNYSNKSDGNSALHYAVEGSNKRIVRLLLKKGIRIIHNNRNETALDFAVKKKKSATNKKNYKIVSLLQKYLIWQINNQFCPCVLLYFRPNDYNKTLQNRLKFQPKKLQELGVKYLRKIGRKDDTIEFNKNLSNSDLSIFQKLEAVFMVNHKNLTVFGKWNKESESISLGKLPLDDLIDSFKNPDQTNNQSFIIVVLQPDLLDLDNDQFFYLLQVLELISLNRNETIVFLQKVIDGIDKKKVEQDNRKMKEEIGQKLKGFFFRYAYLTKLIKECEEGNQFLNDEEDKYRKANLFLYFLETLSMEYDNNPKSDRIKFFIENYFVDSHDLQIIKEVRRKLFHEVNKKFDLIDIENNFFACDKNWTHFLEEIKKYIDGIAKKLLENKQSQLQINHFLKSVEQDEENSLESSEVSFTQDELLDLVISSYKNAISEKLRFHFLVNVFKMLKTKLEGQESDLKILIDLRNEIVQEIQMEDPKLRYGMSEVKELLFKILYSEIIYELLASLENFTEGGGNLMNELEKYNKKVNLGVCYEFEEDADRNFGLQLIEKKFSVESTDIREFVKINFYIKLLIEDDRQTLSDEQRSRIFDYFQDLKMNLNDKDINKLKNELINNFSKIDEKAFEKTIRELFYNKKEKKVRNQKVKFITEEEESDETDKEIEIERIVSIVILFKNMYEKHKITVKKFIKLYKLFFTNREEFNLQTEKEPKELGKDFRHLTEDDYSLFKETWKKPDHFIKSILKMYSNSLGSYKLDFTRINEAFNDEIFLNLLVQKLTKNTMAPDLINSIIKKCSVWDFSAPFIAKLSSKLKDHDQSVEDTNRERLTMKLLSERLFGKHLSDILKRDDVKKNLFEVLFEKIELAQVARDNLKEIFKEQEIIQYFFDLAKEKIQTSQNNSKYYELLKLVLSTLKEIIHEIANQNLEKEAQQILSNYIFPMYELLKEKERENNKDGKGKKEMNHETDREYLEMQLKSIVINLRLCEQENEKETSDLAESNLEKIKSNLEVLRSENKNSDWEDIELHVTYTSAYLLSFKHDYRSARKEQVALYEKIISRVSNLKIPIKNITKKSYEKLKEKEKYKNLMKKQKEYEKYFDVLEILIKISDLDRKQGFRCLNIARTERAIKRYQKVYEIRKNSNECDEANEKITRLRRKIAKANVSIGNIYVTRTFNISYVKEWRPTLKRSLMYYSLALANFKILYQTLKRRYGNHDRSVKRTQESIEIVLVEMLHLSNFFNVYDKEFRKGKLIFKGLVHLYFFYQNFIQLRRPSLIFKEPGGYFVVGSHSDLRKNRNKGESFVPTYLDLEKNGPVKLRK